MDQHRHIWRERERQPDTYYRPVTDSRAGRAKTRLRPTCRAVGLAKAEAYVAAGSLAYPKLTARARQNPAISLNVTPAGFDPLVVSISDTPSSTIINLLN